MIEKELVNFNNNYPIIKLTNDKFAKVFLNKNPELLKKFLIKVLDLDISKEMSSIKFLSGELPPSTIKEYLKTVDFNILINDNIIINLEINRSRFSKVSYRNYLYLNKLVSTIINSGEDSKNLRKYNIYQININAYKNEIKEGIRISRNIYEDNYEPWIENVRMVKINLAYYKNLLYTEDEELDEKGYILAALLSENILELNSILKKCTNKELREKILKEVMITMSDVKIRFTKKEAKALDDLIMMGYEEDIEEATNAGKLEGIKQGKLEGAEQKSIAIAKSLLKEKISLEVIKKATGLSMETIKSLIV